MHFAQHVTRRFLSRPLAFIFIIALESMAGSASKQFRRAYQDALANGEDVQAAAAGQPVNGDQQQQQQRSTNNIAASVAEVRFRITREDADAELSWGLLTLVFLLRHILRCLALSSSHLPYTRGSSRCRREWVAWEPIFCLWL